MTNFKIYYRFEFLSYKEIANGNIKKMERKSIYQKNSITRTLTLINKNDILNMIKDDISIMIDEKINNFHKNQVALTFEENIRKALQIELNWSQSQIPRDFFYREIKLRNSQKSSIIWKNSYAKISNKNGYEFYIKFNESDKSCEVSLQYSGLPFYTINNYSNIFIKEICGQNLVVFPSKRIEMGGIFEVRNFHFPYFNENEASVIYQNFDDEDIEEFSYIIVEIKESSKNISELIEKIKYDKSVMEKLVKKQLLFFCFYKKDVDVDVDIRDMIPKDINLVVIQIKNGYLFGRNMLQNIDWALVNEFRTYAKNNDKKLEDIKNEVEDIKNEVEDVKNKIKDLSEKIGLILNMFPQYKKDESTNNLGKKTQRNKH